MINFPQKIWLKGQKYHFDCIAGNGDAVYVRTDDKNNRYHALLVKKES